MHAALGADATLCGYAEVQIEACLEALASQPVHQEAAGAAHMLWLLERRGLLPGTLGPGRPGAGPAGMRRSPAPSPHPEVVRLRFHPELSPVEGLPADLRGRLLRIWLAHAEGVLRRRDGRWEPVEAAEVLAGASSRAEAARGGPSDTTTHQGEARS
jgi:hypothetical protein